MADVIVVRKKSRGRYATSLALQYPNLDENLKALEVGSSILIYVAKGIDNRCLSDRIRYIAGRLGYRVKTLSVIDGENRPALSVHREK